MFFSTVHIELSLSLSMNEVDLFPFFVLLIFHQVPLALIKRVYLVTLCLGSKPFRAFIRLAGIRKIVKVIVP